MVQVGISVSYVLTCACNRPARALNIQTFRGRKRQWSVLDPLKYLGIPAAGFAQATHFSM